MPQDEATSQALLSIPVEPAVLGELAMRAAGRNLVIDYFASRRCGVVTGDLTARFQTRDADGPYVELAPIEGVRVVVAERLVKVLTRSGPTLRVAGPSFRRRLFVELARPELWLDFLDQPGVLRGRLWD